MHRIVGTSLPIKMTSPPQDPYACQVAGNDIVLYRNKEGTVVGMSRRGNCWDNAVAESFFSSLKKERVKKRIYKTRDLARADIFNYIEMFYNPKRRHSHLGGVSPEAFETASFLGGRVSVERG